MIKLMRYIDSANYSQKTYTEYETQIIDELAD